jgi:hypothetical protein
MSFLPGRREMGFTRERLSADLDLGLEIVGSVQSI